MTVQAIPEGYHSVNPVLIVQDGRKAVDFYKKVFGATERMFMTDPDGNLAHAEIEISGSTIMLGEENPDWHNQSPASLGGTPVVIHVYVEDVDAVAKKAVDAGSEMLFPVEDQFYGDRSGRLKDPFGHMWMIATHKEDVSPEEIEERAAALFGG
ncbi:MAG: VOC family protein [Gemmatimonadota bacterium]